MELFSGGLLDRKVMEKVGCSDYNFTNWDPIRSDDDIHQRNINYKLNLNNGGEVTSTQQKSQLDEKNGWLVEEVMTLQGISYGECFNVSISSHPRLSTNYTHYLFFFFTSLIFSILDLKIGNILDFFSTSYLKN